MATNNLLLLLSMIAIKATRQGKRRLHWPMVEPDLVAEIWYDFQNLTKNESIAK